MLNIRFFNGLNTWLLGAIKNNRSIDVIKQAHNVCYSKNSLSSSNRISSGLNSIIS